MVLPKAGFKNARTTYNTGNYVDLGGVVLQIAVNAGFDPHRAAAGLADYFIGNIPAMGTSLASVLFFLGGIKYDKARINGRIVNFSRNKRGHLLSAIGAALLATGLVALSIGNSVAVGAAVIGGALHVIGKVGSVVRPGHDYWFKKMPLLSRIPAITAAGANITRELAASGVDCAVAQRCILPATIILCSLIWGRADVMMMLLGRMKRFLSKALFAPYK